MLKIICLYTQKMYIRCMKRFNFWLDSSTREKIEATMKTTGHLKIASFIRFAIIQFPYHATKGWNDDDMIDFARKFKSDIPDRDPKDFLNQYKSKRNEH